MANITLSRFQASCKCCGFLDAYPVRHSAQRHAENHFHGDTVEVFDLLAHIGLPQLWEYSYKYKNWFVTEYKPFPTIPDNPIGEHEGCELVNDLSTGIKPW